MFENTDEEKHGTSTNECEVKKAETEEMKGVKTNKQKKKKIHLVFASVPVFSIPKMNDQLNQEMDLMVKSFIYPDLLCSCVELFFSKNGEPQR